MKIPDQIELDSGATINEIVARYPETIPVFNRFGIDTCCGGGVSLREAAHRDDVSIADLLSALTGALEQS